MKASTLALVYVLSRVTPSTLAWVSTPGAVSFAPQTRAPAVEPLVLRSSTLEQTETSAESAAATATAALKAPYAAALDGIKAKLVTSIPEQYAGAMLPLLEHFALEYMTAHQQAYEAGKTVGSDPAASAQRFLTGISYGLRYGMPQSPEHYTFDVTHQARRGGSSDDDGYGGVDFYKFGCDFFTSCMDLTSPDVNVLGQDNLQKIVAQVEAGENVVFLANHQSEADPQVVSACLTLAGLEQAGADLTYVAGHKVTTDPLAIPFSMGRNLICIHSKKHIDADPETKPVKQKQNLKAMNALLQQFKDGGALVWVAPSGGRDRRNVETNTVPLAPFDRKTIDMFRLLGNKSKVPTHFYSMAMVSYDLCPPPDFVAAGTGETRNVRFVPVGIAVGNEVESVGGLESRDTFTDLAERQCQEDYEKLIVALKK